MEFLTRSLHARPSTRGNSLQVRCRRLFSIALAMVAGCGGATEAGVDAGPADAGTDLGLADGCECVPGTIWAQNECGIPGTACGGIQRKWCGADCQPGPWEAECFGARTPAASETCGNDIDDDCDGEVDEGC